MRFSTVVSILAIAGGIAEATLHSGRSLKHVGKKDKHVYKSRVAAPKREQQYGKRDSSFPYLTNSTASKSWVSSFTTMNNHTNKFIEFSVNGSAIPDVDFDVGESYAGLLPISKKANETRQLYFWFYPSTNELASDEILIWLNGGVSCFKIPIQSPKNTSVLTVLPSPDVHLSKVLFKKTVPGSGNMEHTLPFKTPGPGPTSQTSFG